jgi:hypothetical protein
MDMIQKHQTLVQNNKLVKYNMWFLLQITQKIISFIYFETVFELKYCISTPKILSVCLTKFYSF